jgi:hypothetical protein
MEPVVGIFPTRVDAERAAREIRFLGFSGARIELLLPGKDPLEHPDLPTEEAESPGVGQALGGVVGAAAGASAGFGLGAVTASLLVPGLGVVTAIGLAAAAMLAVVGAAGGAAAGGALEKESREGVPRDEIHLYEDALARGKGVLFAIVETEEEENEARRLLEAAGAESLDAARQDWMVGIRDPESGQRTTASPDLLENVYRRGFQVALQPGIDGRPYEQALEDLRQRAGDVALSKAFQKGYSRGAAVAKARIGELQTAERK